MFIFLVLKLGQNGVPINQTEIAISSFFLFFASLAYGWIGINFAIDDRKLNKIISPLMIINSLFYISCIFYSLDFPTLKLIIFLIFSKAFWSIAIIPFANNYFRERSDYAKVSKHDLLHIIQIAIANGKLSMDDITGLGLNETSVKNIVNHLEFCKGCSMNSRMPDITKYKDNEQTQKNN